MSRLHGAYRRSAPGTRYITMGNTSNVSDKIATGYVGAATLRSYSFWACASALHNVNSTMRIFDRGATSAEEYIGKTNANAMTFFRAFSTAGGTWSISWPLATYGTAWWHYGWSFDASSSSNDPLCFINGKTRSVSESTAPSGTVNTPTSEIIIGNRSANDRAWQGGIADFTVWDAILTQSEFAAISQGVSPRAIRPSSLALWVDTASGASSSGVPATFTGTRLMSGPYN